MELAEKILNRITICKPQKKFLITLFTTILIARGKINFRNLSRYSHYSERTYTRQFDNPFDFMAFNRAIINESIDQDQGPRPSLCTYPGLRMRPLSPSQAKRPMV